MTYPARNFKQLAHEFIDNLPDDTTWPNLIDRAAERQDMLEAAESSGYEEDTETPDLQGYNRLLAKQHPEDDEDTLTY
jgi:hypothetical protein